MNLFSTVRGAGFWRGMLKRPSTWLLLSAGALYLLQLVPFPGVILMMFGAGVITGTLLLLAVAAFFVEAAFGFIPRVLGLVPIGLFAWYYGMMASELLRLPGVAAALDLHAPQPVLAYDPAKHTIAEFSLDLMARYRVASVYTPAIHNIRTIGETRTCELLSYRGDKRNTQGVPLGIRVDSLRKVFCFSSTDASPEPSGVITFGSRYAAREVDGMRAVISTRTVSLAGVELGGFDTASVEVLKPFPMLFVGCGLMDNPAGWVCSTEFVRDQVRLEADGQAQPEANDGALLERIVSGADKAELAASIATMLSLSPRTEAEIEAMTRLE